MESLGNLLTFGNRPWKNLKEGSWRWKRTEKGTGEGSYSKTGTEEKTGEGSWLLNRNREPNRLFKIGIAKI